MSWKERRIVTFLLIIIALLAAALLIVLSIRYRAARAAEETPGGQADAPAGQETHYTALSYDNGAATLSFALNDTGAWYWADDPDFPLRGEAIPEILALLDALTPQQTIAVTDNLEDYGLDDPAASLTAATSDGGTLTLEMGSATTDGSSHYYLVNGNTASVSIFDNALYTATLTPIYDMMALPALPALSDAMIQSISIQGPAPDNLLTTLTSARTEGSDTVTWRAEGANVSDDATVRALLEDLRALVLEKCVDYRPSDQAASLCGFSAHSAILTVSYTSSTGAAETLTLTVGNPAHSGDGRCVRVGEDPSIYLLPTASLDPLMRVAASGLEG